LGNIGDGSIYFPREILGTVLFISRVCPAFQRLHKIRKIRGRHPLVRGRDIHHYLPERTPGRVAFIKATEIRLDHFPFRPVSPPGRHSVASRNGMAESHDRSLSPGRFPGRGPRKACRSRQQRRTVARDLMRRIDYHIER